jgi:hypothetical protein
MLTLNNARQGFFDCHEFDAVLEHMPGDLRPPLVFAFLAGWRLIAEVLPTKPTQLDLKADVVLLEVGTTKNKEGRSFYTSELRKVIKTQIASSKRSRSRDVRASWTCGPVTRKPKRRQSVRSAATLQETAVRELLEDGRS